jgi:hypothetical protein
MAITIKKSTLTLKKQEQDPIAVGGPVLSTVSDPASSWTVYAIAGLIGVLFMAALIFIQFLEHSHYKNAFLDPQVAAAAAAAQAAAAPAAAKTAAEAPEAKSVKPAAATSAPAEEKSAPEATPEPAPAAAPADAAPDAGVPSN